MKLNAMQIPAIALLMTLATPGVIADTSPAAHVTRFELVSHGMTVGHGRIIRAPAFRNGKPCLESRLIIESKVDLLFFKYALNMDERWVADPSGLIAYKLDNIENGRHKTISGELTNGVFQFEITEAGQKRTWTTPRTAFDSAANGHPGQALADGEAKTIKVLDPAAGTITERIYRETGREMLTVGKQQIMCNTMTIECPGTHIRRWFITDEFGPLILREDGREGRGTYSRRAISMGLERKAAD